MRIFRMTSPRKINVSLLYKVSINCENKNHWKKNYAVTKSIDYTEDWYLYLFNLLLIKYSDKYDES